MGSLMPATYLQVVPRSHCRIKEKSRSCCLLVIIDKHLSCALFLLFVFTCTVQCPKSERKASMICNTSAPNLSSKSKTGGIKSFSYTITSQEHSLNPTYQGKYYSSMIVGNRMLFLVLLTKYSYK
ncbi:hypothetical protein BDW59DRAFT_150041 [Aspergillus cavernicola]|uniref:Uncharacterized protein n=1 Tax=Aspergillus cavernicola TaxID=176166 RepID=A0ABR4I265_9EURO